jgi:uncharacterized protein YjbI with pentapeptide repeats
MNPTTFDGLAIRLSHASDRRGVLRALLGAALGGALAGATGRAAAAYQTTCDAALTAAGCAPSGPRADWSCPFGANLRTATLSGCPLVDADLPGADLLGANLGGANLTSADLSGANLTYAYLGDATLAGADLSGVLWQGTTCPDGTNSNSNGTTCCGHLNGAAPRAGC